MRLPRTLIIATVVALTTLATLGFGTSQGEEGPSASPQNIVLVAGTADAMPLGHDVSPPLGPIPCLDGSTVDIGQFCPLPTIQCANGSTVPLGQFCPVTTVTTAAPAPKQAPQPVTCPDGSQASSPDACTELGAGGTRGVACPDGSVAPAGQQCPTSAPAPPAVLTVKPPTKQTVPGQAPGSAVTVNPPAPGQSPPVSTVYLCGAGYRYEGGLCVGNAPVVN